MQNDNAISVLNNLIEACKDGENGFKQAAEALDNPSLKATCLDYSRQRGEMARELQSLVRSLGGDPEQSGSMGASMHRGWIDIKSAVTDRDSGAVLAEAERGEDSAKAAYEKALNETLPPAVQNVVQMQAAKVRQAHDDVRALRDREKASL
ncbi:MAG: PA2169 family four-helix-bundle protein [Acidobacteriota bacterium]